MKRITYCLLFILFPIVITAQVPQAFNYQAVYRDLSGNPVLDQSVTVIISILQGAADGTEVFTETQSTTTNDFGLINLQIGSINTTNFAGINWANSPYYMKINVNGTDLGTTQLISVPYALHAVSATDVNDADHDQTNEIQDLTLSNNILNITNNLGASNIDLSPYLDNTDSWLLNGSDIYFKNGNVGIGVGTSTPAGKLYLRSSADDNKPTLYLGGGGDSPTEYPAYIIGRSSNFNSTVLHLTSNRSSSSDYNFLEAVTDHDGTPSTAFVVKGDAKVGIGLSDPSSPLTVSGIIESTIGGLKFPDGTIQTTSAVYNPLQYNFSFPDGFNGLQPITMDSLYYFPFTVPQGMTLYITNIQSNYLTIEGNLVTSTTLNDSGNPLGSPFIVGSGQTVSCSNGGTGARINGFLVKSGVTPITLAKSDLPYSVSPNKIFVVLNLYSEGFDIFIDDTRISSGSFLNNGFGGISLPILVDEDQLISTTAPACVLNGYLIDK